MKPASLSSLVAFGLCLLCQGVMATPAAAAERAKRGTHETVVLTTGVRMNVKKAELIDGRYQLDLLDGGRVWLPESLIARIAPPEALSESEQPVIAAKRTTVTDQNGQVVPPARLPKLAARTGIDGGLPKASPEASAGRPGQASPLNPNHRVGIRGGHPVKRRTSAEAREAQYTPGRGKMAELLRRMNRGGPGQRGEVK